MEQEQTIQQLKDVLNPTDEQLDQLWEGLGEVTFNEDNEADGGMVLAENYHMWETGCDRQTIWEWFDQHYSEGLGKRHF